MVCARRTVGLEIILDAPDGNTRRRGSSGTRIGPFGDKDNLDAR